MIKPNQFILFSVTIVWILGSEGKWQHRIPRWIWHHSCWRRSSGTTPRYHRLLRRRGAKGLSGDSGNFLVLALKYRPSIFVFNFLLNLSISIHQLLWRRYRSIYSQDSGIGRGTSTFQILASKKPLSCEAWALNFFELIPLNYSTAFPLH